MRFSRHMNSARLTLPYSWDDREQLSARLESYTHTVVWENSIEKRKQTSKPADGPFCLLPKCLGDPSVPVKLTFVSRWCKPESFRVRNCQSWEIQKLTWRPARVKLARFWAGKIRVSRHLQSARLPFACSQEGTEQFNRQLE